MTHHQNFFVKNISNIFDCNVLLNQIKDMQGSRRSYDAQYFNVSCKDLSIIFDLWKRSNYFSEDIEWYNYYSGKDFDSIFSDIFSNEFNASPLKVWVSKIMPGKCFPRHWDVDEIEYNINDDQFLRYQLFLSEYKFGHVFILENNIITNQQSGDVWKWRNHRIWHGGVNLGFEPKYIFNYLGIKK
jgi:hypothetical protein